MLTIENIKRVIGWIIVVDKPDITSEWIFDKVVEEPDFYFVTIKHLINKGPYKVTLCISRKYEEKVMQEKVFRLRNNISKDVDLLTLKDLSSPNAFADAITTHLKWGKVY